MIAVVGLSHKTASIEVREKLALSSELGERLLAQLVHQEAIVEALVVSTCNRVEIVAMGKAGDATELDAVARAARGVIAEYAPGIEQHLYTLTGEHAVHHVFRVASSLDSLVMGEPQILGQVKSAYETARRLGTVGGGLNRVVSHALRAAKRVRTETTLGAGQVSVPSVAVDLARQIFGDLKGHRALLIGSGQMGEAAAKLLTAAGVSLGVVGRNRDRVCELARQMGGEPYTFEELEEQLATVDVIVTATSSPTYVLQRAQIDRVKKRRRGRSLFLIDLAVPRDVDPRVDELESVFLYNVDDLSKIVADTFSSRQREAETAEAMVLAETKNFGRALHAEQATPTIVALRQQLGNVLQTELERSLRGRLKHLEAEDREALERMLESALNKMLHPATRHLRSLAIDSEAQVELDECVASLRDLFALSADGTPAPSWRPATASLSPPAEAPASPPTGLPAESKAEDVPESAETAPSSTAEPPAGQSPLKNIVG
jgi:glutamyl-tRNA reductase